MKIYPLLALLCLTGCAYLHSTTQRTTDPKSGAIVETTSATGYALFDANSSLLKFRNQSSVSSNGCYAPGTFVSGLNEQASSSNVVQIINALGGLATSAAAAAAK